MLFHQENIQDETISFYSKFRSRSNSLSASISVKSGFWFEASKSLDSRWTVPFGLKPSMDSTFSSKRDVRFYALTFNGSWLFTFELFCWSTTTFRLSVELISTYRARISVKFRVIWEIKTKIVISLDFKYFDTFFLRSVKGLFVYSEANSTAHILQFCSSGVSIWSIYSLLSLFSISYSFTL